MKLFALLALIGGHGDAHQELGEQSRAHLAIREPPRQDEEVDILGLVRIIRFHLDPQGALSTTLANLVEPR